MTTYYLYYEDLKMAKALASTYTLIPGEKAAQENSRLKTFFLSPISVATADWIELDIGFTPKTVKITEITGAAPGQSWDWNDSLERSVNSQSLVAGVKYKILTVGGVNYTLVGAPNNEIGAEFVATGVAATGGTCLTAEDIVVKNTGGIASVNAGTNPSIIAKDRSVILSENTTIAMITTSKTYSIVVTG